MDKIWWTSVPNPVKYINDITEAFSDGKSVVCVLPEKSEWIDTMRSVIMEKIRSGVNKICVISGKDTGDCEPGQYLAQLLVKQEIRVKYRTSIGYEMFLTKVEADTSLIHSYVYLKELSEKQSNDWLKFISGYNSYHSPDSPRCKFIMETSVNMCENLPLGKIIRRSDYFRNFDISILCMLASSDINVSDHMRNYLIDLSVLFSENDPELASMLISYGENLAKEPERILREITEKNLRSNMMRFTIPSDINNLIWKAQHRIFYPLIEQYRLNFIKNHENDFPLHEKITNSVGEEIESVYEIELNTIKWLYDTCKLALNKQEHEELKFFKQCRNELAHLGILDYPKLQHIIEVVCPRERKKIKI